MPLSPPRPREHLHTRKIECRGYRRDDGLWDIEGHIVDTKSYDFPNEARGEIKSGTPVHDMWIRLTIDGEYRIHGVEAVTDAGPYRGCGDIAPDFVKLKGLKIGPGWTRQVKERVGGTQGCTHLVELLRPIATVCYQTIVGWRIRMAREQGAAPTRPRSKPRHIDSCHMYRSDGEVVRKFWPEFYTGS